MASVATTTTTTTTTTTELLYFKLVLHQTIGNAN